MSFRSYLLLMALGTFLAWAAWMYIIFSIDPSEAGASGFAFFYITLTTWLIGTLSLAGILYRVVLRKRKDVVIREVKIAFRHAILLSAIAVGSLALMAKDALHWWVLLVIIAAASLIEYVSLLVQHSRRG